MSSKANSRILFAGLILLFLIWVIVFGPNELPEYKQRILACITAFLGGLFFYLISGALGTHWLKGIIDKKFRYENGAWFII